MSRKDLDIGKLNDFQPRNRLVSHEIESASERPGVGWSRREAPQEGQFTIRAKLDTIERFKRLCRPRGGGRFTYGEMLERLMDSAEGND